MKKIHNYINGSLKSISNDELEVEDPSTGETIGKVVLSSEEDFKEAIESSKSSQVEWANTTPLKRSRILSNYKTLIENNIEDLAKIVSQEHGKTLDDAKGSVTRGLEVVEFSCGIPHLLKGEFSQNVGTNIDSWSIRQPLGICAGITPFNFPAMVPMWMFPMAIACGNTFILKPSEKDPSCSMKLAELFSEAGLPDGVLNIIQGGKIAGESLVSHPLVSLLSFTGSTVVGRTIAKSAGERLARVSLELGGKNAMVICDDADVDQAVHWASLSAFSNAGQRCAATSRILIFEKIYANYKSVVKKETCKTNYQE